MGRLNDLRRMIKEKRIGFLFDEVMTGKHRFEPGFGPPGDKFMQFKATWGPKHFSEWINPFGEKFLIQELTGTVTIEGLCENAPMSGTLELKYFSERKIRYTFEFTIEGKKYQYIGEKVNILPWNLPTSHTTCFGRLTEKKTGKLVSTSVTYFKLKTMPGFLLSFRLA